MSSPGVLILDGYVDEPSTLGVPPSLSPYARYVFGAAAQAFEETNVQGRIEYLTINGLREYSKEKKYRKDRKRSRRNEKGSKVGIGEKARNALTETDIDVLVLLNNTPVPGNYLRGRPASPRELNEIAEAASDMGIQVLSWKTRLMDAVNLEKDCDAFLYDILTVQDDHDRFRSMVEWDSWAIKGAALLPNHPDLHYALISELDTLKGCVRYINGGCTFCTDPLENFRMRPVESVLREVETLVRYGGRHVRLGGSCIFSYQAEGIGESDRPTPNPMKLTTLFEGIRILLPEDGVFHTDNANAGIISAHPDESREVLKSMVKYSSPGNSLSLGLESADPKVIERNHLNAKPGEVREAVTMINEVGRERGENGMPKLLPGLNLLYGLPGEDEETHGFNFRFLKRLYEDGYLFRRINIRQLSPIRIKGSGRNPHFQQWKDQIRREIDVPNLKEIIPKGTVLRRVHIEHHDGEVSFGRQVGTYPILVGIPFPVPIDRIVDVKITGYGQRSITGIPVPLQINHASLKCLMSLPGIGKKRATRIVRNRPIRSFEHLVSAIGERAVVAEVMEFCSLD